MKKWGIIGALIIAAAVAIGYFYDFPAENIVEIGVGAFGLCAMIIGAVQDAKAKQLKTWPVFVCIIFAILGGVFCCIGGLTNTIFAEIAGAMLALLAVIFGIFFEKK